MRLKNFKGGFYLQYDFCKFKKKLKKELDKDRYDHTIGVMDTAACLAMKYDCNLEQAMVAGLLHDCAKCIDNDKKIELCEKNKIILTSYEKENPFLIHAKLGAFLAKKEFEVKDEAVLHAISVHTTGCPNMNLLDKIIYIADYIEPNRKKAINLPEVRKEAFTDIDQCLIHILADTLAYLNQSDRSIDPMTQKTYDFYVERN